MQIETVEFDVVIVGGCPAGLADCQNTHFFQRMWASLRPSRVMRSWGNVKQRSS